jgi:hypothetical protein
VSFPITPHAEPERLHSPSHENHPFFEHHNALLVLVFGEVVVARVASPEVLLVLCQAGVLAQMVVVVLELVVRNHRMHGMAYGGVPGMAYGGVHGMAFGGVPGMAYGGVHGMAFGGVHGMAFGGVHGMAFGM